MSENSRSPTLAEVFSQAREVTKRQIRCALIGQVQSYNASTQTANVQPVVDDFVQQEDGTYLDLPFPVLTNVPVQFPCGGSIRMTFPVQPGDTGLLVVTDLSLDRWKNQGGQTSPNTDQRRHHPADAVFVPGVVPNPKAWTSADASAFTLGPDTGPQVVVRQDSIELGGSATSAPIDAMVKGTTYRTAQNTLDTAWQTFQTAVDAFGTGIDTFSTSFATYATGIQTNADPMNNFTPTMLTAIGTFGALGTALVAAAGALSAAVGAFEAGSATYLSDICKVG